MEFDNRRARRWLGLTVAVATAVVLSTQTAGAQYFGRNKVQHRDFKFEVLETDHFGVYFYPIEREAAHEAARMAERWYARLSALLDHHFEDSQPLVLYASHADFEQTNVVGGDIGEGTGGVTEGLKRRIVLPIAGTLADTDHVVGHELVHAFQYDIAARQTRRGLSAMGVLPLWMVEGMAEYLSIGPVDPHTAMWIRDASREDSLPDIDRLDDPRLFPYRWGQALWSYLAGRWGDDIVGRIFVQSLRAGSALAGIEGVTELSIDELSAQWHAAIRAQYQPILEATQDPSSYGRRVAERDDDDTMSVSPSLSPDGRQVVFFSQRNLFSLDLYLADVESGRILRRLVSTGTDEHFTSLQFISSAGSWHPGGRQFVLGAISDGQATLAIIDVETSRIVSRTRFPELGEILNPAWSPDGRFVAFSATDGGHSDLFIYDLETEMLRQVTRDAFADLQPAWAPDGRRLAIVTDRYSTDLALLRSGPNGLALVDVETGALTPLPTFDRGKSINPQWAPDGRRLAFLSDRTGVTNIYVIDVESGGVVQLTNISTGVSGITALSPALSSSIDARRLAYSAYDGGNLGVYVIDGFYDTGTGTPPLAPVAAVAADVLPPEDRATDTLQRALADATTGLPDEAGTVRPYEADLSLDFVGQPYLSAGVNQFGPTFGGGLSFLWSDMLGNHTVLAGVDVNSYGTGFSSLARNTGGLLAYRNLTRRWNWGLSIEQSPNLTSGFLRGVGVHEGQPALIQQDILQRQTYRSMGGGVAYPFSRTRRIEFNASYDRITFDREVRTQIFSLVTGRRVSEDTETIELAEPLNLGTATVATVRDTSVFGALGPIVGERSRLALSPTVGDLGFTGVVADYRRYVMPVDFYTIAGRALHIGRYGGDAEDSRLLPLFIGYPEIVRGYGIGSFTADECTFNPSGRCEEISDLFGSRLLVGNLELRFPILRPFGVRSGMYGPLPVEVALFADAGVAWNGGERPALFGGSRAGVSSAGVTLRANLLGFMIGQLDLVRPFQRPGRGWMWAFSLTPGF